MFVRCRSQGSVATLFACALTACGGGGDNPPLPAPTFTVGGTVSGLNGSVVLQNNGADNLTVSASGAFVFATRATSGAAYAVTVLTPPVTQNCTVTNGSSTVGAASVSNISVVCVTPFAVSSTTPVDGEINVPRTIAPAVVFSSAVDSQTARSANITLASSVGSASAAVTATGTQVTLTPARHLLPLTQYTLTVTPGVKAQGGELLLSTVTRRFTTRDGVWGASALLENGPSNALTPDIAADVNGNAIAVWSHHDGLHHTIWANRYVARTGWGVATLIGLDTLSRAFDARIAMDPAGNALAVWAQGEDIWSNRYVVGTGWGTPALIEISADDAMNPQIAIDANGNALAVWSQGGLIACNRYVVGVGWGAVEVMEIPQGSSETPQIAIDASGNAVAVWAHTDSDPNTVRHSVWANRFVIGTGWGAPTLIETNNVGDAREPQVKVDPAGNAMVVWHQGTDTSLMGVWANRYVPTSGWATPTLIDEAEETYGAQIAMDAAGNALAIWRVERNARNSVWSSRFELDTGWSSEVRLADDVDGGNQTRPEIVFDVNGNALGVWAQRSPDFSFFIIRAGRYLKGKGWSTPVQLDTGSDSSAGAPRLAIDSTGGAFLVWPQAQLTQLRTDLWASRFE